MGCPLAPLLFVIALDPLLWQLSAIPGVKATPAFADDLTINISAEEGVDAIRAVGQCQALIARFCTSSQLQVATHSCCTPHPFPVGGDPCSTVPTCQCGCKCVLLSNRVLTHREFQALACTPWGTKILKLNARYLGVWVGRGNLVVPTFQGPWGKFFRRLHFLRLLGLSLTLAHSKAHQR